MIFVWTLFGVVIVGGLAWYLLIETEGVYLGQRVVTALYDLYAARYDSIKQYAPLHESLLLATPIMNAMRPHRSPLLLDVATGTARLPIALLKEPNFDGHIIAVDISRKMLQQAAYKLADDLAFVDLLHAPAHCLPFPDESFDTVTFLEALEFVDNPESVLAELLRVLRPGGLLLTTIRINVKTMPGKIWSQERMESTLKQLGIERLIFEEWQDEYTKVWARKAGKSDWVGAKPLESVLRCPRCNHVAFEYEPPNFVCGNCTQTISVGDDGVLAVLQVQRSVRFC